MRFISFKKIATALKNFERKNQYKRNSQLIVCGGLSLFAVAFLFEKKRQECFCEEYKEKIKNISSSKYIPSTTLSSACERTKQICENVKCCKGIPGLTVAVTVDGKMVFNMGKKYIFLKSLN